VTSLIVDFAGERSLLDAHRPFVIGREGDLRIDDNPYLHRRFIEIRRQEQLWWLLNVGTQLSATVSAFEHGVQAWLSPGGSLPLVFPLTVLRFTAGATNYEVNLELGETAYRFGAIVPNDDGATTVEAVTLTGDQRLMLVALAENALRRQVPMAVEIPSSSSAARRLGWTLKKFEKKIDNVCDKFAALGVSGLKGDLGNSASSRRARLVEYSLAARVITQDDLALLEQTAFADVRGRG
jgi:hypothetical protein